MNAESRFDGGNALSLMMYTRGRGRIVTRIGALMRRAVWLVVMLMLAPGALGSGWTWVDAAGADVVGARGVEWLGVLIQAGRGDERMALWLAEAIGTRAYGEEIAQAMELIGACESDEKMLPLARGLGQGMARAGLGFEAEKGAAILERARRVAEDPSSRAGLRAAAIELIRMARLE